MRLGTGEILLILAVLLLMFGGSKLPQLGDALGKGIRSFKKAVGELDGSGQDVQEQRPVLQAAVPASRPEALVEVQAERRG